MGDDDEMPEGPVMRLARTATVVALTLVLTGCASAAQPETAPVPENNTLPEQAATTTESAEQTTQEPTTSEEEPAGASEVERQPNLACKLFDHELASEMGYPLFRDEQDISELGLSYFERIEGESSGCKWNWQDSVGDDVSFSIAVSPVSEAVQEEDGLWTPWFIGLIESVSLSEDKSTLLDGEGQPLPLKEIGNLECGGSTNQQTCWYKDEYIVIVSPQFNTRNETERMTARVGELLAENI